MMPITKRFRLRHSPLAEHFERLSMSPIRHLALQEWIDRADAHAARVAPWCDAFVDRRSRGQKHPVDDFLFTYYNFSPAKLKQWMPSLDEELEVSEAALEAHPWLRSRWTTIHDGTLRYDFGKVDVPARRAASFIASLSASILARPARLRCFGLHEWAMVYHLTPEQVRHSGYRLRLPPETISAFVESQTICCTHYDAFRFFTPDAAPLNTVQPTLDTRIDNEQGACLHANMDLYKWAYKMWPWCGSDLIADTFLLALEGRNLDMRASPYELAEMGYPPVRVETEAGRQQYVTEQQSLAAKAIPVRERVREAAAQICAIPALPAEARAT